MCFEAPAPVLHLRLHLTLVFVEWCERRALYVLFQLSRSVFGDASTTMFAFVFILSWLCLVCRHVYMFISTFIPFVITPIIPMFGPPFSHPSVHAAIPFGPVNCTLWVLKNRQRCHYRSDAVTIPFVPSICAVIVCVYCVCLPLMFSISILHVELCSRSTIAAVTWLSTTFVFNSSLGYLFIIDCFPFVLWCAFTFISCVANTLPVLAGSPARFGGNKNITLKLMVSIMAVRCVPDYPSSLGQISGLVRMMK